MMAEQSMQAFTTALASAAPVPGGGGACGYAAALGMALGSMVANLTTGKKKYAAYQEELDTLLPRMAALTEQLTAAMDADAEAFAPLAAAYGLPKETPEQIAHRTAVMEAALDAASAAPLHLMGLILDSLAILERLSVIGSRIAISDVGVGAQLAKAALNGAALNVYINTKLMQDRTLAGQRNEETQTLTDRGNALADAIYTAVLAAVR